MGDTVRASTVMPRQTMDDLGITADDKGEVLDLDTAQDQVFVSWKRLGNTAWCEKAHLQVSQPRLKYDFLIEFNIRIGRKTV